MPAAPGAELAWPRGTFFMRVLLDPSDLSGPKPILSVGPAGEPGSLRVTASLPGNESGAAVQAVIWNPVGEPRTVSVSGVTARRWYNLALRWGERGLSITLDDVPGAALGATAGWRVSPGDALHFLAEIDGAAAHAQPTGLSTFALWDVQLSERELHELMVDPHVAMRPPAGDAFLFKNNPLMTRPTRSDADGSSGTLTFNVVTSGAESALAHYRIRYRTRGTRPWYASVPGIRQNTSDQGEVFQSVPIVVHGLQAGAEYEWLAEWTADGRRFYPFPGGLGRFRTEPARGQPFSFAFVTDDHLVSDNPGGPTAEVAGINVSKAEMLANWRTDHDLYALGGVDFVIDGGDNLYTDRDRNGELPGSLPVDPLADLDPNKFARIARWVSGHNLRIKTAPMFMVLGNHEGEYGYHQNCYSGEMVAMQKQGTIARKRGVLNPGPETYAHQYGVAMGEGEPDPGPEGNDWVPALDDVDAAGTPFDAWQPGRSYRDDFVYDRLGPGGSWGENRSPLLNYYAWRWSDLLCIVLDVGRYSRPGERVEHAGDTGTIAAVDGNGGEYVRPDPPWRLGPQQRRFVERVLAAAANVPWKLIFLHHLPGGERIGVGQDGFYGRGSGVRLPVDADGRGADQLWLTQVCRRYGVAAVVKGHDHKFALVEGAATFVSGPTAGARTHVTDTGAGWNTDSFAESYGTSESLGRYDAAGQWLGDRIKAMFNVVGYLRFDVSAERLTLTLRQTYVSLDPTRSALAHYERWIGPVYQAGQGRIDLRRPDVAAPAAMDGPEFTPGETPGAVGLVASTDDLNRPAWWEIGQQPSPVASYESDAALAETHHNGPRLLVPLADGARAVVAAVPRDVFRCDLTPRGLVAQSLEAEPAGLDDPNVP